MLFLISQSSEGVEDAPAAMSYLSPASLPLLPLSRTQGAHCLWLQEGGNGVRHIRAGHTGVRPDP